MSSQLEQAQARIAELEARIAELTAPKQSNRKRAATVTVDGVVLADQQDKASAMKRLANASKKNLERLIPLRLKAMHLGGKHWRIAEAAGVAPMIEVNLASEGEEEDLIHFNILAGSGDWTDYYLVQA